MKCSIFAIRIFRIKKSFQKEIVNPQIAKPETIRKLKKVLENVVKKGTANNIYSSNFSMAGKTGTAKKYVGRHVNEKGDTISGGYSNKRYVASFAGFFPAEAPKYSCIVVVHDPNKKKGYYGATVAAPIFKEIAQKIYTTTPIDNQSVKHKVEFESVVNKYKKYILYIYILVNDWFFLKIQFQIFKLFKLINPLLIFFLSINNFYS